MQILHKISLGIILSIIIAVLCEDKEEAEEEKDPWDKSTDKYRHHLGSSSGGAASDEPLKIDVTEVSESEVTSGKSKVCNSKDCKKKPIKEAPPAAAAGAVCSGKDCRRKIAKELPTVGKVTKGSPTVVNIIKKPAKTKKDGGKSPKKDVDKETKDQINDAIDEKDPADVTDKADQPEKPVEVTKQHKAHEKFHPVQKEVEKKIDNNPAGYTPEEEDAKQRVEAKENVQEEEEKSDGKFIPKIKGFGGWSWKGPQVTEVGHSWGTPCWFNKQKKKFTCKQLVPSHYYGPPSAGWGGFQPGHQGSGWGTPYWYKKCAIPQRSCRQLVPTHYYGPPSAGWGGFQPGHTGSGWGTPYWYKKCAIPQANCKPTRKVISWGGSPLNWNGIEYPLSTLVKYRPAETAAVVAAPVSWYKKAHWKIDRDLSRKGEVPSAVVYKEESLLPKQDMKLRNAAFHEWILHLERERAKDRELERYKVEMRERDSKRRYAIEMLHYYQSQMDTTPRVQSAAGSVQIEPLPTQISYYDAPQTKALNDAVDYLLTKNDLGQTVGSVHV